ncbi:MAG: GxxExxY protein [Mariprofundales bacterium]|nr:GxxExxY protein [Mariprofundales bacterium]
MVSNTLNTLSRHVVDAIFRVHQAQILTYMKLTNTKLGLLVNFNVPLIVTTQHPTRKWL